MIKITKKSVRIMLVVIAVVSVWIGLIRGVALINYIEPETGFYVRDTAMELLFNVAMAAVIALTLACGFVARKTNAPEQLDSHSMVVVSTSALCAFMYLTVFVYSLYKIIAGYIDVSNEVAILTAEGTANKGFFYKIVNIAPSISSNGIFLIIQTILCPFCFMNHISICSKEVREKNTSHAVFAMSEALFFAARVVEIFMNTNAQINTSQRSLELLMLCAMMLFFLFEAGFLVKRDGVKNSLAKYLAASFATVSLPLIAMFPYLAVSLFWPYFDANFVVMDVLEGCIMLFAASRVMTLPLDK